MPVGAGIQNYLKTLDSRLHGNDVKGRFKAFYETINCERPTSNNVFCQFKKNLSNTRRKHMRCTSESTLRNSIRLSRSTLSLSTKSSRPKGSSQAAVRLF